MAIYSDLNSSTPTKKSTVIDIDSIAQSVDALINTKIGTRMFNPEFGLDLEQFLFELIDVGTELQVYRVIGEALSLYEPRVTINYGASSVTAIAESNELRINMVFNVKGTSQSFNVETVLGG